MALMQVTMGFTPKDLQRLDDWAAARRLKRNAAVLALLDLAEPQPQKPLLRTPGAEPAEVGTARAAQPDVGGRYIERSEWVGNAPPFEKKEELPLIRSPEEKAAALALLKPKLAELPDVKGIHEANREKPDPPGWDEYDQGGDT